MLRLDTAENDGSVRPPTNSKSINQSSNGKRNNMNRPAMVLTHALAHGQPMSEQGFVLIDVASTQPPAKVRPAVKMSFAPRGCLSLATAHLAIA